MQQYGVPVVLKTWCLIQEAVMVVLNMMLYLMPKTLNLKAVVEVPNMVLLLISICLFMICFVINPNILWCIQISSWWWLGAIQW